LKTKHLFWWHIAPSRKQKRRVPGIVRGAGRRITNPPQVDNLPHMAARRKLGTGEIVAGREDWNWIVVQAVSPADSDCFTASQLSKRYFDKLAEF